MLHIADYLTVIQAEQCLAGEQLLQKGPRIPWRQTGALKPGSMAG